MTTRKKKVTKKTSRREKCCKDYGEEPCFHWSATVERVAMGGKAISHMDLYCDHCGRGIFVEVKEIHKSYKGHNKKPNGK